MKDYRPARIDRLSRQRTNAPMSPKVRRGRSGRTRGPLLKLRPTNPPLCRESRSEKLSAGKEEKVRSGREEQKASHHPGVRTDRKGEIGRTERGGNYGERVKMGRALETETEPSR